MKKTKSYCEFDQLYLLKREKKLSPKGNSINNITSNLFASNGSGYQTPQIVFEIRFGSCFHAPFKVSSSAESRPFGNAKQIIRQIASVISQ